MRRWPVFLCTVLLTIGCTGHLAYKASAAESVVRNGDFEGGGSPLPGQWVFEKTVTKGTVA
jgi:hypothetical protein